jgi:hypothetical protein
MELKGGQMCTNRHIGLRISQIISIAFQFILLFAVSSHSQEEIYHLEGNKVLPLLVGLQPKISPESITVRRGDPITFRRTSTHDPDSPFVREDWEGPAGQRGSVSDFTVRTDQLSPAKYTVKLTVVDSRGRQGTAVSTFEVVPQQPEFPSVTPVIPFPKPAKPTPAPEPTPKTPPKPPPIEDPHAVIYPTSREVKQGDPARFESRSTPNAGVHETWTIDLNLSEEGSFIEINTQSLTPGTHTVTLTVTDNSTRSSSATASLYVTESPKPTPSPGQGPKKPPLRPSPKYGGGQIISKPPWGKIGTGAGIIVALFLIGYLLKRLKGPEPRPSITPLVCIVPMADRVGIQHIEGELSKFTGPEICLEPVSDPGIQEITDQREPFIKEERRYYE